MIKRIIRSLVATCFFVLLLCAVYPLAVTFLGQIFFLDKATGQIVRHNGKAVGSLLIGQNFNGPQYFHARPSAAGDNGYDPMASGGSNYGPTNKKLSERMEKDIAKILAENPGTTKEQIPVDLVTASASGLDPHISPEAAYFQMKRVARARHLQEDHIQKMISDNIENSFLGEPVVNVLKLNLTLDNDVVHP